MIYKYYTCDLIPPKDEKPIAGATIAKFYIFNNPLKCFASMRNMLDDGGFKDYKMKNFRRVK